MTDPFAHDDATTSAAVSTGALPSPEVVALLVIEACERFRDEDGGRSVRSARE